MGLVPGVNPTPVEPQRMLPDSPVFDEAFWVAAAEGAIRDYCGWHVAPIINQVFAVDGQCGRRVLLPTLRLREVTEVLSDGSNVTARVVPSEAGLLELPERFGSGLNSVIATVVHGYAPEEVPSVMAVIASAASRFSDSFGNVVQSQAAGGSSVTFFAGADALLSSERARLDPYRLKGRT